MNAIDANNATLTPTNERPGMETFTAYVDGSSLGNPGPSGWSTIIDAPNGSRAILSGSAQKATNNQMELWATLEALAAMPADAAGVIFSDSRYVVDGLTKWRKGWARRGWRKAGGERVLNTALWKVVCNAADARPGIRFEWVRGHDGNTGNERADSEAKIEAEKVQSGLAPKGGSEVILEDCALEDAEVAAGRAVA